MLVASDLLVGFQRVLRPLSLETATQILHTVAVPPCMLFHKRPPAKLPRTINPKQKECLNDGNTGD